MELGDFVTITCEIPHGLCENDSHTPHVKGNLGIITQVLNYKSCDGFSCFTVKDNKGNEFVYAENELIPVMEQEKKYWYPVGNVSEGDSRGWVYLTETEAKIVKYATNSRNWECMECEPYSGCFWIDLEDKQTEKPTSAPESIW